MGGSDYHQGIVWEAVIGWEAVITIRVLDGRQYVRTKHESAPWLLLHHHARHVT